MQSQPSTDRNLKVAFNELLTLASRLELIDSAPEEQAHT